MSKIVAVSDLHGQLPEIEQCDFLLIGGDICPHFSRSVGDKYDVDGQAKWLDTTFRAWLDAVPAKHIVATLGNHDWVGEHPKKIPSLKWNLLMDKAAVIEGLKFYGTPWQPEFCSWAFNAQEHELQVIWEKIPDDTDILVLHGPPRGYGDRVPMSVVGSPNKGECTGSPSLLKRILTIKPKLAIFGHIHAGRGAWDIGKIRLANVSVLNDNYNMVYQPMVFEI